MAKLYGYVGILWRICKGSAIVLRVVPGGPDHEQRRSQMGPTFKKKG